LLKSYRRPLAIGAVLAAVAGGTVFAYASHGSDSGLGGPLTASSGTQISVSGGAALHPTYCDSSGCTNFNVIDAQWSADGSRAIFINQYGEVATVRYNDENDVWFVADHVDNVERTDPTYSDLGDRVAWSERDSGGAWQLAYQLSGYGSTTHLVSPNDGADYTDPDGGPDGTFVVERTSGATHEIQIWDPTVDPPNDFTTVVAGEDPAMSPDGLWIAYVSGGQIWKVHPDGLGAIQVTTDASAAFTNPTWSPDSLEIAFNSGTAVRTVVAAGGASVSAGMTGTPAYRSARRDATLRLAGSNRYSTAAAVSQSYWGNQGDPSSGPQATAAVLSRSDNFADALGGSALAAHVGGPLLLTPPTTLNADTQTEMQRVLGNSGAKVYLLGGTAAISTTVESQVQALGYTTVRISGADRYATAVAIAGAIDPDPDLILTATGQNFPDALGAGAAAGSYDYPGSTFTAVVVLTNDTTMPAATNSYLSAHAAAPVFAIGAQADVATGSVLSTYYALVGSNRYQTASFVSQVFFSGSWAAGVATGTNWPDALAGGALMAALNGPLLLTPSTSNNVDTDFALSIASASLNTAIAFGGTTAVSDPMLTRCGTLISGPGGAQAFLTAAQVVTANKGATNLLGGGEPVKSGQPPANGSHRTLDEIKAAAQQLAR
jgi:putative cell wall-binding protein